MGSIISTNYYEEIQFLSNNKISYLDLDELNMCT